MRGDPPSSGVELGESGDASVVASITRHDRQAMFERKCAGKDVVGSCPDRKISIQEVGTESSGTEDHPPGQGQDRNSLQESL